MWVGRKRRVKIPAVPQCSISGLFLIVAVGVLLKIIAVFCSTIPPWQGVLPLLRSAFEICRKWGRIFGSWWSAPESPGVAGLCFGSPSESCAGVWVLGISHCLLWALQSEREGLPNSLSRVAVLSSTSWISTSLSFSTTASLGDLSDSFS